jgi:Mn2+-dependent serine/threonine protein kinase
MGFYGCIWTGERVFVEPLTPLFDFTTHWTNDVGRGAIAAALHAFLNTVPRFEAHYERMPAYLQDRTYPYKTDYQDGSGQQINFRYTSRFPEKLVFTARTGTDNLCVKFAKQYSEKVHRFLAELSHAPKLRAVTVLPGGWNMIVMDFSHYVSVEDPTLNPLRDKVKSKVMEIVQKLHSHNFVHGDIRPANILVNLETPANSGSCVIHLIDFDWAGTVGEAQIPYAG